MIEDFNLLTALAVLIGNILVDGLYAQYTFEVVSLKPARSATIGAVSTMLIAYVVISYTDNWLYIFPLVAGSWIGTYYVVKNEQKKSLKKDHK
ncbi:MAG: hypothetical protein R3B53_03200 [Candidatus Paceibacterota bacterium]